MKMNTSVSRLYLTAVVSFILGMMLGPVALFALFHFTGASRNREKMEAKSFSYRTMHALFQDAYSAEEGSVSPHALKTFTEYKSRLGNECKLFIVDSTPGYYECAAFFPSGDRFNVGIVKRDGRWVLEGFTHQDWDRSWKQILYIHGIDRKK